MPKYEVVFTRTITESATIIVSAPDRDEAEDAALSRFHRLDNADWEVDDNSSRDGDVYVSSFEEVK